MQHRPLITSRDNPLVQRLRRLLGEPAAYRREGVICIEGEHLCSAFVQRRGRPKLVVLAESAWQRPELRGLVQAGDEVQSATAARLVIIFWCSGALGDRSDPGVSSP